MKRVISKNLLRLVYMQIRQARFWAFNLINFLDILSNIEMGRNVNLMPGLRLNGRGKIVIGDNSTINKNVRLIVNDEPSKLFISDGVQIEDNAQIICVNSGEIIIGKGSIVGKGVKIVCYGGAKIDISENVIFQEQSELKTNSQVSIGTGTVIGKYTSIAPREEEGTGNFICGYKCAIHEHNFLDSTDSIVFGDEVATGPYDIFYTHDHSTLRDKSIWDQPAINSPISIGDGSWIGSQVIILPGVQIGQGSVIAAGAVVTREVKDFTIVAGVPAKLIRERIK